MSHIHWDGDPPSDRRLPIMVARPSPGQVQCIRLLGKWDGVWLHWQDPTKRYPRGRTWPCMRGGCPRDHLADPPFWYGYAPAQIASRKEVTDDQQPVINAEIKGLGESVRARFGNGQESRAGTKRYVTTWGLTVCPITEDMAQGVIGNSDPRGLVLQLRLAQGIDDVTAEILERIDTSDLPEPFDVRPILMRMWRMRGWKGGA